MKVMESENEREEGELFAQQFATRTGNQLREVARFELRVVILIKLREKS